MGLVGFLNQAYVQAIFWLAAAIVASKFIKMPEISGGGHHWKLIAIGIIVYGARVSFKLIPGWKSFEVYRYVLGIIGGLLILLGMFAYYYTNLSTIIKMREEV